MPLPCLQEGSVPAAPDNSEPTEKTQIWGTNIFVSEAMGQVRRFMSEFENDDGDKLYPSLLEEVGMGSVLVLVIG
jgi:hypothetical protein